MCGMNSDRCFTTVSEKAQKGGKLGGVIISLQQTQFDHLATLRIFAPIQKVMHLLLKELDITSNIDTTTARKLDVATELTIEEDVYLVPYQSNGHRLTDESIKDR